MEISSKVGLRSSLNSLFSLSIIKDRSISACPSPSLDSYRGTNAPVCSSQHEEVEVQSEADQHRRAANQESNCRYRSQRIK